MMEGGGKVLACTIDDNRRSALHFAAALGKADLIKALVHYGAAVDLGDKDGVLRRAWYANSFAGNLWKGWVQI